MYLIFIFVIIPLTLLLLATIIIIITINRYCYWVIPEKTEKIQTGGEGVEDMEFPGI